MGVRLAVLVAAAGLCRALRCATPRVRAGSFVVYAVDPFDELRDLAKAPPGSLEAAKEGDYELWISKQLRLNRIQACSTTVKEDLVRSLRSATALSDVTAVVEGELRQLLFARNGVGDMARSTLIAGEWDELLPISGVKRRVRVLGAPDSGRTVIEREVRFLGPALGLASVFDAVALDSTTLRLRRRVWRGSRVRLFGARLTLPRLWPCAFGSAARLVFVDADVVVLDDCAVAGAVAAGAGARRVWATAELGFKPKRALHAWRSPLMLRARLRHILRRTPAQQQEAAQAPDPAAGALKRQPAPVAVSIGTAAWSADTAMDVDDAKMQEFLTSAKSVRSQFSVQDMLEGRLSKPPRT